MLSSYLPQTAEHRARIGTNKRSEPSYGPASNIKCRKQSKTQEITLPDQQKVITDCAYYLAQAVNVGDTLDGRNVLWVEPWHSLSGEVIGYKAVV